MLRLSRHGFLAPLLSFVLGACDSDCRLLCGEWYDYQRDICGVVDTEDPRVTCVADYKSGAAADEELAQCRVRRRELTAMRRHPEHAVQQACCTWDEDACNLLDDDPVEDDDSSTP